jgi:hypothetical protein
MEVRLGEMAEFAFELAGDPVRFDVVETPVYGGRQMTNLHGQVGLTARAIGGTPV